MNLGVTEIKDRPILFSAPMVLAILANEKSQTRRIIDPQPAGAVNADPSTGMLVDQRDRAIKMRYGLPGDRLWVRETLAWIDGEGLVYEADKKLVTDIPADAKMITRGRLPCILMPRWASRITLEIDEVRVERLQMISDDEARAEGIVNGEYTDKNGDVHNPGWRYAPDCYAGTPRQAFELLWQGINGAESWAANPWVFVIKFVRVK